MKKILIIFAILLLLPLNAFAREKTHLHVAFTIDNNYPMYTLLAINSILVNNISKSDYTFYIVENNVTDKNKEKMRRFIEKNNQKVEFIHVDTSRIDQGKNLFVYSNRITSIAFARILLPDLLPKDLNKVLYLDSDILVTTDLKPLYDTNLKGYNAAMALNTSQNNGSLTLYKFKHGYYNSGMILMNLDKCRKENSPQKMINFVRTHEKFFEYNADEDKHDGTNKYWLYPDQDVINIVWDGKIKKVPQKWNNQCIFEYCMIDPLNGCIIHYIGKIKPWEFIRTGGSPYAKIYLEYLSESPFAHYKYLFAYNVFRKAVKYISEKKIKRYKNILSYVLHGNVEESLFWIFYVPSRIEH